MNILMILKRPAYGTERVYNGLRLATNLLVKHQSPATSPFTSP